MDTGVQADKTGSKAVTATFQHSGVQSGGRTVLHPLNSVAHVQAYVFGAVQSGQRCTGACMTAFYSREIAQVVLAPACSRAMECWKAFLRRAANHSFSVNFAQKGPAMLFNLHIIRPSSTAQLYRSWTYRRYSVSHLTGVAHGGRVMANRCIKWVTSALDNLGCLDMIHVPVQSCAGDFCQLKIAQGVGCLHVAFQSAGFQVQQQLTPLGFRHLYRFTAWFVAHGFSLTLGYVLLHYNTCSNGKQAVVGQGSGFASARNCKDCPRSN